MTVHTDPVPGFERKTFGQHETITLGVDNYVRLPQVRSGMNPQLGEIKDSIRERGLLNQIDVARMTEEQLDTYVDFVNRTWGTDAKMDDYLDLQQGDGCYYLVVAGHTRTEAVQQLQDEEGEGNAYDLVAKVHPISDPQEIISLQLDENLHSTPAQEQRAIAIVETYRYGIENGLWVTKKEFLEASKSKFSRTILNEAIGFAQLPQEARDFVFSGRLSYNAAVALGAATDTIIEYSMARLGQTEAPEQAMEILDEAYRKRVGLLIAEISNRGLNGTAAKKFIKGQVGQMAEYLGRLHASDDEPALLDLEMVSAAQQADAYMRELSRKYEAALRLSKQQNINVATQALALHRQLIGEEGSRPLIEDLQQRRQILGGQAVRRAAKV